MQTAIIVFPGSNREQDMFDACVEVGFPAPIFVWHRETTLPATVDLVIIPGGFSYGDYLRSGAIAARSPIVNDIAEKAKKGLRVLGVCNGFQVLTEAGLLPGALLRNSDLRFVCKQVALTVENTDSDFTHSYQVGQTIQVPVAHDDGNYMLDSEMVKKLEQNTQIAFRYVNHVNGSTGNIAGVFNDSKTILGMMPHPENAVFSWQASGDGKTLFTSLLERLSV